MRLLKIPRRYIATWLGGADLGSCDPCFAVGPKVALLSGTEQNKQIHKPDQTNLYLDPNKNPKQWPRP